MNDDALYEETRRVDVTIQLIREMTTLDSLLSAEAAVQQAIKAAQWKARQRVGEMAMVA